MNEKEPSIEDLNITNKYQNYISMQTQEQDSRIYLFTITNFM